MGRQPNERSEVRLVDQNSGSWNQLMIWLRNIERLRQTQFLAERRESRVTA
jgi:hypothetical protein